MNTIMNTKALTGVIALLPWRARRGSARAGWLQGLTEQLILAEMIAHMAEREGIPVQLQIPYDFLNQEATGPATSTSIPSTTAPA